MRAILNQVHIKLEKPKDVVENGIHIPESSFNNNIGKITSVGKGVKDEQMDVKIGDRVKFREGTEEPVDEAQDIYLIYQRNILAVI